MKKSRTNRTRSAMLPATAASKRLGYYHVGSEHSRAAARALVFVRQESQAEGNWDKELDCTGLAESLNTARQRAERGERLEQLTPIYIPPGKENTVRGRLAVRMNAAKERMRQYETR